MIKGTLASYSREELDQKVAAAVNMYIKETNCDVKLRDEYLTIALQVEKSLPRTMAIMNMQWRIYTALKLYNTQKD